MEVDAAQDYLPNMNFNFSTLTAGASGSSDRDPFNMDSSSGSPSRWQLPKFEDSQAQVDEHSAIERPFNLNERVVNVLDQLDTRVEKLRKDALGLQEKRDFLLMSIDLIKNNDTITGMNEHEREEIHCYIQRVNARLSTVELNVKTVRDAAQEDSLHQINILIDSLITSNDPVTSRQRCQTFLNACSGSDAMYGESKSSYLGGDHPVVDKKFESALLGCTLDDQKNIKKRLQALMNYLNKQTICD